MAKKEMEMYSLAENAGEPVMAREPYYPSIRIMSDNAPEELLNKEVGHVCDLHVIAKKVSERALPNGKKEISVELMRVGYTKGSSDDYDEEEA